MPRLIRMIRAFSNDSVGINFEQKAAAKLVAQSPFNFAKPQCGGTTIWEYKPCCQSKDRYCSRKDNLIG